jgi:hypothetical protein
MMVMTQSADYLVSFFAEMFYGECHVKRLVCAYISWGFCLQLHKYKSAQDVILGCVAGLLTFYL